MWSYGLLQPGGHPAAFGRVMRLKPSDMIAESQLIALVEIASVGEAMTQGKSWTFSRVADAQVKRVIKGDCAHALRIYGGEDFPCAQTELGKGLFLVFLKRDGRFWTGANFERSLCPVADNVVDWYDDKYMPQKVSLPELIGRIEAQQAAK